MKLNKKEIIFVQLLHAENLKFTPQRRAVFNELLKSKKHRDSEEIFNSLKDSEIDISLATIYRTLDILVKHGFARKLDIGDGRSRYESKIEQSHHDHLICIECGKIIEFVDDDIEVFQERICEKYFFKSISHTHQIYGLCHDCQQILK